MNDLISIIIPVYNVEKYIHKCLDTVINQTHKNLEIILVDDGSPDNCPRICDEYAQKDNRIKVIHQQNQGVSTARNAALDIATGDYIGFVDPDDYIDLDMFEYLLSQTKENDADISICQMYSCNSSHVVKKQNYSACEAIKAMLMSVPFEGHLWNKLFNRAVIKDVRFNCEIHMHEDLLFAWEVFSQSEKITYSSEEKYHYILHPEGACSRKINEKAFTLIEAHDIIYTKTKNSYPEISSATFKSSLACLTSLAKWVIRDNGKEQFKVKIISTARRYMRVKEKKSIKSAIIPFVLSIGSVGFEFYAVIYKLYRWIRRK